MDSLKQETQGLQKEKEVRIFLSCYLFGWLFFFFHLKVIFVVIVKTEILEKEVWTFSIKHF